MIYFKNPRRHLRTLPHPVPPWGSVNSPGPGGPSLGKPASSGTAIGLARSWTWSGPSSPPGGHSWWLSGKRRPHGSWPGNWCCIRWWGVGHSAPGQVIPGIRDYTCYNVLQRERASEGPWDGLELRWGRVCAWAWDHLFFW